MQIDDLMLIIIFMAARPSSVWTAMPQLLKGMTLLEQYWTRFEQYIMAAAPRKGTSFEDLGSEIGRRRHSFVILLHFNDCIRRQSVTAKVRVLPILCPWQSKFSCGLNKLTRLHFYDMKIFTVERIFQQVSKLTINWYPSNKKVSQRWHSGAANSRLPSSSTKNPWRPGPGTITSRSDTGWYLNLPPRCGLKVSPTIWTSLTAEISFLLTKKKETCGSWNTYNLLTTSPKFSLPEIVKNLPWVYGWIPEKVVHIWSVGWFAAGACSFMSFEWYLRSAWLVCTDWIINLWHFQIATYNDLQ